MVMKSPGSVAETGSVEEQLKALQEAYRLQHGDVQANGPTVRSTTADITLSRFDKYMGVDTTNARTITLPLIASVEEGHEIKIKDETKNAATKNITVARNGANIDDNAADVTIAANSGFVVLMAGRKKTTSEGWFIVGEKLVP